MVKHRWLDLENRGNWTIIVMATADYQTILNKKTLCYKHGTEHDALHQDEICSANIKLFPTPKNRSISFSDEPLLQLSSETLPSPENKETVWDNSTHLKHFFPCKEILQI